MGDYNDRLTDLKLEEKATISKIRKFMENRYRNGRTTTPGYQYARFLEECLQRFTDYLKGIDGYYSSRNVSVIASLSEYKNLYSTDSWVKDDSNCYLVDETMIRSEFVEKIAGVAARAAIDTLLKDSANTVPESDKDGICQNAIKCAFDIAQEYYNVSRSYLNDTCTAKQIDLLDRIMSTAKTDFDCVVDMLDLTNDYVCKFLPCFLTAFVCSGARRDLFSRSSTGIEEILRPFVDETNVEEYDREIERERRPLRRMMQIQRLSNTFSLKGTKFKFKKSVSKRPKRYIVNRSKANLDALFATHVFMALSTILFDTAQDMARKAEDTAEAADMAEKAKEVVSKIDLKSCYALLLDYTDPDSPDLKNILSDAIWKYPKYNEILLHNFRFETESVIF
ncbi:hypothetical protein AALA54_14870 [Oscillospiraceae bacterium 44-34]